MTKATATFDNFDLHSDLLRAIAENGYTAPSPIQERTIPVLMSGKDLTGLAATGTGKTAAFALPLLHKLKAERKGVQALILTPTRELGLQVAEALRNYARYLPHVSICAIYGGQDIRLQLRQLKDGPTIIVGTPGRVIDHLKRGSLNLSQIETFILDEADEMLRMGFIDDVEKILDQAPDERQTVLFSATMPDSIQRVSRRYLKNPVEVSIERDLTVKPNIEQFYFAVEERSRSAALLRFLESETIEAAMVFVRTRQQTNELAELLSRYGYPCAALSGDAKQSERERVIGELRAGRLKVVIATDVAARGLDVSLISHVFNYEMPGDIESYIHRIGRTGRAGRTGRSILLVSRREIGFMRRLEKVTGQSLKQLQLPNEEEITAKRIERLQNEVLGIAHNENEELEFARFVAESMMREGKIDPATLAAALLVQRQKDQPLQRPLPDVTEASSAPIRSSHPHPHNGGGKNRYSTNKKLPPFRGGRHASSRRG